MKKLVLVIIPSMICGAVLLLSQCKTSSNKLGGGGLVEIDVSQKYPLKELFIQDIAKVEYIPLETNRNTLMRSTATIVHVSDDYIIASNTTDGDVFVFDGNGKSKFSFNRKGPSGVMEYRQIVGIAFDEKAKEVFISDNFSRKIFVYAENGEFKRGLAYPISDLILRSVFNFDDETLLVYDEFGVSAQNKYSNKPYLFMSKKDGSIVDTLNFYLPERVSNRVYREVVVDGKNAMQPFTFVLSNNRSYGKNFLIADWSSDTIYKLTIQKELQPVIVRKPSVQKTEPKIIISNDLVTDKFILLDKSVLDVEMAIKERTYPKQALMYNFETGEINEYRLINKDGYSNNMIVSSITPENTGVGLLDVSRVFEADEAGRIKGELKELLKSLDEEDNPILMKIKF